MFKIYLVFSLFFLTTTLSFSQNSRAKDSVFMIETAKRVLKTYNVAYLTKAADRLKIAIKSPVVLPEDDLEYAKTLYMRSLFIGVYHGKPYFKKFFTDLKVKAANSNNLKLKFWTQLITVEQIMEEDFAHLKVSDFEALLPFIEPGSLEEGHYYSLLSNVFLFLQNNSIAMNYSNAAELIFDNIDAPKFYYKNLYDFRYAKAYYSNEYQDFVKNSELQISLDNDDDLLVDIGFYLYLLHHQIAQFDQSLSNAIKERFDYIVDITSFAKDPILSFHKKINILVNAIDAKDAKTFFKHIKDHKDNSWEYNYYHYEFYKVTEQWKKALPHLKKIDTLLAEGIDIENIQNNYDNLIEVNTKLKDTLGIITYQQKKLLFNSKIDSLTKAKSSFEKDFIKQIRALKVAKKKTTNYVWIILTCFLITLVFVILTVEKLRKQKKLFNEQVEYLQSIIKKKVNEKTPKETSKWQKIYNQILEEFCSGEFLNKNYTKATLAKNINSNDKYISQAIKEVRQMSYSAFVVDLKIKVLKNQIESNLHMNKYKPEVLAKTVNLDVRTLNKYFKEHYKISFNDYLGAA